MAGHFVLTVHLHDRRYHGADEWPPAPGRVFQALVAGVARGRHVADESVRALTLLEGLGAPVVAAPVATRGQRVSLFVPNNDLDAVDGNPDRVGEVRTKKTVQPRLFESDPSFLYAWPLAEDGGEGLTSLADGLFQFGRGIDLAWAVGELLDDEQLALRLRAHRGTVHRPIPGDRSVELAVPTRGSFASIMRRFDATLTRLRPTGDGRTNFVQPPKAHFTMIRYGGTPAFHLFELRRESEPEKSSPWACGRATAIVEHVRDTAADALSRALPHLTDEIERVLVGRKRDGANAGPIDQRVRFIPLPSIGHEHADHAIRRVIVQVPPGPVTPDDVVWALAGRPFVDYETGEVQDTMLAPAPADEMVARYRARSRTWKSVTPLALGSAPRRRIEPQRRNEQGKSATEREAEERSAQLAVGQALRHAGVGASLVRAHVQREPFDTHGTRAEGFAEGTRFSKATLWHVAIELDREVCGPLVLGDGRFLGLGVMAPTIVRGVFALEIAGGLDADADTAVIARALRRAVMARAQVVLGARGESELPPYFHGHGRHGEPLRDEGATHLAFSVDAPRSRLLIVPPHVVDGWRRVGWEAASHLDTLERALEGFTRLRAGRAGVLSVRSRSISPSDPLLRSSRVFRSVSSYVVNRHAKRMSAEAAVILDVQRDCERGRLPRPDVRVLSVRGAPGIGVVARLELTFATAIRGPILLGRTRYLGGGLFEPHTGNGA